MSLFHPTTSGPLIRVRVNAILYRGELNPGTDSLSRDVTAETATLLCRDSKLLEAQVEFA